MKTKWKLSAMSILLAVMMIMTATPIRVEARGAHLNKTKVTITEGDSVKLKVSGASGKIKWSTSKKSVATVTQKGVVKAKNEGTAIIKAKVKNKVLKCKVIVETDEDEDWDDEDYEDEEEEDSSSTISTKTDTTTTKTSTPLEDAKAYILANGRKNSYGNPLIDYAYDNYTFTIIYDTSADRLEFQGTLIGKVAGIATVETVHVTPNSSMTGTAQVEDLMYTDYWQYKSTASFNIASYNEDLVVPFTVEEKSGSSGSLSDDDIKKIGQSQLKMTMAGCRLCLMKHAGIKLSDIGFTSYTSYE